MDKGVSGAVSLLFAAQLVLLAYYFSGSVSSDYGSARAMAFSMGKADFLRSNAELGADSAVRHALILSSALPVDSGHVKMIADAAMIGAFYSNPLENQGMCISTSFGQKKVLPLTPGTLGAATRALAVRHPNLVVVEYFVAGTPDGLFPCAEIISGGAVSFFRVPLGYSQTVLVPLP